MSQTIALKIGGTLFTMPFADLFPPLTADEYERLKESIKDHGIKVAIAVVRDPGNETDGFGDIPRFAVIDGQHRLKIAQELNLPLDQIPLDVQDLDEKAQALLAADLNLARRHLTTDQRQQLVAHLRERGASYRQIAEKLGTSKDTARRDAINAGADQPDQVTGADGKHYDAEKELTKVQKTADRIMQIYYERHAAKLTVKQIRPDLEGVIDSLIYKALSLLGADRKLRSLGGGVYARRFDINPDLKHWCNAPDQYKAAILQTLAEHGPQPTHQVTQHVMTTYVAPSGNFQNAPVNASLFKVAWSELKATGEIVPADSNNWSLAPKQQTLDDELDPADPVAAVPEDHQVVLNGVIIQRVINLPDHFDKAYLLGDLRNLCRDDIPEFDDFKTALDHLVDQGVMKTVDGGNDKTYYARADYRKPDVLALIKKYLARRGPQTAMMIVTAMPSGVWISDVERALASMLEFRQVTLSREGYYALAHRPDATDRAPDPDDPVVALLDGQPVTATQAENLASGEQPSSDPDASADQDPAIARPAPDLTALKGRIVHFLSMQPAQQAHWNVIDSEMKKHASRPQINAALSALVKVRRLRKTHDNFYALTTPAESAMTDAVVACSHIVSECKAATATAQQPADLTLDQRRQLTVALDNARAAVASLTDWIDGLESELAAVTES